MLLGKMTSESGRNTGMFVASVAGPMFFCNERKTHQ